MRTFLHGFAQSPECWAALCGPGDACPRLPGHGMAPEDVPSFTELASRLAARLEPATHLVGYSMGGRLALAIALQVPARVDRLTIISAHPGIADPSERARRAADDERLASSIEDRGMTSFVEDWEALPMWASQRRLAPSARAAQRAARLTHQEHGLSAVLRKLGPGVMPDLWPAIRALPMPVDLVVGALDHRYVQIARAMADVIPHATLHIVDEVGHNVVLEAPRTLATILAPAPAAEVHP